MGMIPAILAALLAGAGAPSASDDLPAEILAACDARATPYGRFDPAISDAVAALVDLGVFEENEFSGVAIGYCGLAAAGGPVATASCGGDTILLDEKYRSADQAFPLAATLAHEMKHYLQHTNQKAQHGAGWCAGDAYAAAREGMEEEADAFGDAVVTLLYLGRAVEVLNRCRAPIEVYLEALDPRAAGLAPGEMITVAPGGAAAAPFRAASGRIRYFARTSPAEAPHVVWSGGAGAEKRRVGGEVVRLRRETLQAASRASGAFTLTLACE